MLSAILASSVAAVGSTPTQESKRMVYAETESKIEQFLNKLTPEQRKVLQDLRKSSKPEIKVSNDTDLNSSKEISVIVEFKQNTANTAMLLEKLKGNSLTLAEAKRKVEESHGQFKKDLDQLNVKHSVKTTYKETFNGVAMTIPANQVQSLLQSDVVNAVYENNKVQLIEPTQLLSNAGTSAYSGKTPQELMGVDKLHYEGVKGQGVKVGVLDTGIDYNHPDLEKAYKGGYDFVDEDSDPMETTIKDWKSSVQPEYVAGRAYYTAHGTHVSGIIAGQGKAKSQYAMEGVAPDADLYVYRVLGPYGSGTTEDILEGIEKAVIDKMDVINMSLGANYNDPYSPLAIAINNAVLSGVTCVLAAGNTGSAMYTVGTPAASALAITVGSSNTEVAEYNYLGTLKSNSTIVDSEIRYSTNGFGEDPSTLAGKTFDIVDLGQGLESDYSNINVEGKIALVSTGTTQTNQKVLLAKQHGAAAIFIYNNSPGFIADKFPVAIENTYAYILSGQQGLAFKEILKNETATYTFTTPQKKVLYTEDGLSYFSSRGPASITYDIKPEVTAPGFNIMSTVPSYLYGEKYDGQYQYGYAQFSGTSMASPQVAGVAALLLGKNPEATPAEIKTSLMNSADEMVGNYSVYEIGSGRVDAYEAVHSQVSFQVKDKTPNLSNNTSEEVDDLTGALNFGSLYTNGEETQDQREIVVQNNSSHDKTFDIAVSYKTVRNSLDAVSNGIELKTKQSIQVERKSKERMEAEIHIPSAAKYGMYEGYITFTNRNNPDEIYQIPFGVRKVKEGIEYLNLGSSVTTLNNGATNNSNYSLANFKLNSHIRYLDIFLADENSQDIGYIGNYDGIGMPENAEVRVTAFSGEYYPIGITAEQLANIEPTQVKPGMYKVKFVFTDVRGKKIIIEKPILVDNTSPKMTSNLADGVVELDPNNSNIEINGNVMDQGIIDLRASGTNLTQGNNKVFVRYNNNFPSSQPINAEGNFNYKGFFPSYLKVLPIEFNSTDMAGNKSASMQYYFVKKGTPYVSSIANQKEVTQGETVTFNVNAANQGVFKKAELEFRYDPNVLSFTGIALKDTVKDRFDATMTNENDTIKVSLQAKDSLWNAEDVLSLLELKALVKNDTYFNDYTKVSLTKADFTNTSDIKTTSGRVDPSVKINASHSLLLGTMFGEAIYKLGSTGVPIKLFDYSKIGASVKVFDEVGKQFVGKVLQDPNFEVGSLPSTREKIILELDIPGHFTVQKSFNIGLDNRVGEKKFIRTKLASAGDVNKDHVIDILDAIYLEEHWGTNDRKGDINFDGKIDLTDMNYIKVNFLKENPTVPHQNQPKATENGKTLESIINSLTK